MDMLKLPAGQTGAMEVDYQMYQMWTESGHILTYHLTDVDSIFYPFFSRYFKLQIYNAFWKEKCFILCSHHE